MTSAGHALGDFGKTVSESLEVDKGSEEGRDLNIGLFADVTDKGLEGGKTSRCGRVFAGCASTGRGRGSRDGGRAGNHVGGALSKED